MDEHISFIWKIYIHSFQFWSSSRALIKKQYALCWWSSVQPDSQLHISIYIPVLCRSIRYISASALTAILGSRNTKKKKFLTIFTKYTLNAAAATTTNDKREACSARERARQRRRKGRWLWSVKSDFNRIYNVAMRSGCGLNTVWSQIKCLYEAQRNYVCKKILLSMTFHSFKLL